MLPAIQWSDVVVVIVHFHTQDKTDGVKESFCDELELRFPSSKGRVPL
jgi:hypothetical protein